MGGPFAFRFVRVALGYGSFLLGIALLLLEIDRFRFDLFFRQLGPAIVLVPVFGLLSWLPALSVLVLGIVAGIVLFSIPFRVTAVEVACWLLVALVIGPALHAANAIYASAWRPPPGSKKVCFPDPHHDMSAGANCVYETLITPYPTQPPIRKSDARTNPSRDEPMPMLTHPTPIP